MANDIKVAQGAASAAVPVSRVARFGTEQMAPVKTAEVSLAAPRLSSLALQLSESAERANVRDSTLTRQQLGDFARQTHCKLAGSHAPKTQAIRAQEVPESDDPQRRERAIEATRFVANNYQADSRVTNPFAGLSRDELILIAYDDSGAFTLNERDCAWKVSMKIENAWSERVVKAAWFEKKETGVTLNLSRECLERYRGLPAIEQALHCADYEANLLRFIQEDLQTPGNVDDPPPMLTLVEFLARMNRKLPIHVQGGENLPLAIRSDDADEGKT